MIVSLHGIVARVVGLVRVGSGAGEGRGGGNWAIILFVDHRFAIYLSGRAGTPLIMSMMRASPTISCLSKYDINCARIPSNNLNAICHGLGQLLHYHDAGFLARIKSSLQNV